MISAKVSLVKIIELRVCSTTMTTSRSCFVRVLFDITVTSERTNARKFLNFA
jgi:hypothetical protein